jgi:5,6-dimethylbenzimidazole synthase
MNDAVDFSSEFRARLRDLITWRRDVRRFRSVALPEGSVERLIDIACRAPSVGLSQPWRFVTVDAPARRAAVRRNFETCNAEALAAQDASRRTHYARLKLAGLDEAPVHLAVFAERETTQGHGLGRMTMPEMAEYSVVAAVHTLWLAARAEGIGLGWVSILDPAAITATLDVPAHWKLVAYLCLGYPAAESDIPDLEREDWEHRRPPDAFLTRR